MIDGRICFSCKHRWVLDSHKTLSPIGLTHEGAVSIESLMIAVVHAALNVQEIFVANIRNTYLNVPSSEKYHISCRGEFRLENIEKGYWLEELFMAVN